MAGKKTFVAGEVLLAQDVNDFLMDQTVMNFAGTAARASAIPTPSEGMFAVTTDNDQLDYYNGSGWVPALPVGAWTAFTPVLNATSGTITSYVVNTARYAQLGKTVHVFIDVVVTNNGTGAAQKELTLPITAKDAGHSGGGIDMVTGNGLVVFLVNTTKVRFALYNYTYPNATTRISFTYEAA